MKCECSGYRVVIGGRVRADLFEFADVVVHACICTHQRPDLIELRLAHIKKSRSDGRQQPLVQTAPVILAIALAYDPNRSSDEMRVQRISRCDWRPGACRSLRICGCRCPCVYLHPSAARSY